MSRSNCHYFLKAALAAGMLALAPSQGTAQIPPGAHALVFALTATEKPMQRSRNALLIVRDFESGDLAGWGKEIGRDDSATVVSNPVRAGKYAARFELRKGDPIVANSKRAELTLKKEPQFKVERWYGFSLFLPEDYHRDPTPEIVTQWHASPDRDQGEVWRSPPLAVLTRDGNWQVTWRWDADRIMKRNRPDGSQSKDLGQYKTGIWTDWVFHVKWSWQADGLLQVWQNGKKVIHYEGPIGYNDRRGVYFKTGIYKWVWKMTPEKDQSTATTRITYVDEVRIGNEKATYQDVSPKVTKAQK